MKVYFESRLLPHPAPRKVRVPLFLLLLLCLAPSLQPTRTFAQEASKLISPGPLTKGHEKYDNLKSCLKCHQVGKGVPDRKCLECHKKITQRIAEGRGLHRALDKPCFKCHTDHKGKDFSIIILDKKTFDHSKTGYTLVGKHYQLRQKCEKCHRTKSFLENSKDCRSCHKSKHKESVAKRECAACHSALSWKEIKFDHGKTEFALTGSHKTLNCKKCHKKLVFQKREKPCQTCHVPKHKGQFAQKKCTECHSTSAWLPRQFDHEKTGFVLKGKHRELKCTKCHHQKRPEFPKEKSIVCKMCHTDRHKGQFQIKIAEEIMAPEPCTSCHSEAGWKPSRYDHNRSKFKLEGKHKDVACRMCHGRGRYKPLETTCASCHKDKHRGQFKVKVKGKEVKRPCEDCHTPKGWRPSIFDHKTSKFKLEGKHKDVACNICHRKGKYKPMETKCTSCHQDAHKGQFRTRRKKIKECDECHTSKGWKPTSFKHDRSKFKLVGAHKKVECFKCHPGKKFRPIDRRCMNCHKDKHKGRYGSNCERCHNAESWKLKSDFHEVIFPLEGAHSELACEDCHEDTRTYTGVASQCLTCHADPHENRFGASCSDCHTDSAWLPSTFTHNQTGFLLLGAHGDVPCERCHTFGPGSPGPGVTAGEASFSCFSCHERDYLNATNPNHIQSGYSMECEYCHLFEQGAWGDGWFNHNSAAFPLVGNHQSLACEQCHIGEQWGGISGDCYSCHWERNQRDPWNLQIGENCEQCHTPHGWTPANWSHAEPPPSYPLEGLHAIQVCLTCHANYQAVGASPECISCHQSDYDSAANPNHVQEGYSTYCPSCHRFSDTSWGQAVFEHNQAAFPLIGNHQSVACELCHAGGQYVGTPQDCYTCHWIRAQDDPWSLQIGQNCERCHSPAGWLPANWSHGDPPATWTLEGVHGQRTCLTCHANYQAVGTSGACYSCHQANYEQTQDPDHQAIGFPTDCSICHQAGDMDWTHGTYDHQWYPLDGRHQQFRCRECHPAANDFDLWSTRCLGCHNRKHKDDPCAECHYVDNWNNIRP